MRTVQEKAGGFSNMRILHARSTMWGGLAGMTAYRWAVDEVADRVMDGVFQKVWGSVARPLKIALRAHIGDQ